MASPMSLTDEYSDLVRINPPFNIPPGYAWVPSTSTASVIQLSQELTFARGRILYEVWDSWEVKVTGWIVPCAVASVSLRFPKGVSPNAWNELPLDQSSVLKFAHRILKEKFSRMPAIAAVRVAEKAELEGWKSGHEKLETMAVQYVKFEWTSFDFRAQSFENQLGLRPTIWNTNANAEDVNEAQQRFQKELEAGYLEAAEIVKPRGREILRSWLSVEMSSAALARFWKKHGLHDLMSEKEEDCLQDDAIVHGSTLFYYGGAETPANLVSKVRSFT